ncbi:TetR/AcrR family transcriptional regulator [Sporolactobacillus inulinus]|uniref:TetR family transcriptional regulator n=2 Tax=Sporolactobacillus inulinus TaxID=2078 RepID=A0A0U1QS17_9BACL|nr:TetR/AcrR family transcriptional regulator [Sporolactobacillus inulinus]KLI03594.1 TetR family transcriptional regulator [Sporolactobacillus inulinus CASD]GEB78218.1 TetR family transcriptional regulator [Sporolactobacillus inulinus]
MVSESTDLRVIKTRAAIEMTFLDLLLQKKFNTLTVKDIAAAAQIGRGTFYLHFLDKYDLLEKVIDEGLNETVDKFHLHTYFVDGKVSFDRITGFVQTMFRHFKRNDRFFRAMFFNEDIPMFRQRMQERFLSKFQQEIGQMSLPVIEKDPLMLEIMPIFVSSAMIGLLSWWFERQAKIPEEEIARRILVIMTQGPLRALGLDV